MIKNNINPPRLLIATTNPGKKLELMELLKDVPVDLVTPDSLTREYYFNCFM